MPPETMIFPAAQPLRIPIESRQRTLRRVGATRIVSCALLCAVVLVILVALGGMALGLWRFTVIDTGSMRPSLAPGDVAVLTSEPRSAIKRGQVVAFHPPGQPRLTVVHRVFAVHTTPDGTVIETKGDANNVPDAWRARLSGETVWRESAKVPQLGYLSVFSAERPVRLALLVAIVLLVVSTLLGTIWRSSPRD